ncbi:uncharacterized protein LOC104582527 [Brachypodium distachyon]|uniref:Uncharacterized protein n=1 Tax=Brachypodium distachyon TaxID=15368 RepID=A0A2K2D7H7_BRADI|nr:uncharacterized protein LOC104582527 [Brachypodium distachyon]PNT70234.1 hypothetical protein BRADI_2g08385v3 [Brachypodium distachyon]|eukprot:XP_010230682.2 uncharacterized protein LOC104582527 [Brachypodium distachyon]
MDRILCPEGAVIIRDKVDALVKVEKIANAMRWKTRLANHEGGPRVPEKMLVAVRRNCSFNQGRRRMGGWTRRSDRKNSMLMTVYVSDIDQQVPWSRTILCQISLKALKCKKVVEDTLVLGIWWPRDHHWLTQVVEVPCLFLFEGTDFLMAGQHTAACRALTRRKKAWWANAMGNIHMHCWQIDEYIIFWHYHVIYTKGPKTEGDCNVFLFTFTLLMAEVLKLYISRRILAQI